MEAFVDNLEEEAFEALATAADQGECLDAPRFSSLLLQVGRVSGPEFLLSAWAGGTIDVRTLAAHVGRVWSLAEFPDAALSHEDWRLLFEAAGFTSDGRPAERPDAPVELWRGSVPERRYDWSWTARRPVAEEFAAGARAHRPTGRLYRTVAPPSALLAHNTGRSEEEYVIDTAGLTVAEVSPDPDATTAHG